MPKAGAKASSKRAQAQPASTQAPAKQEAPRLDWPEGLSDEKAKYLFDFVAGGKTIRKAAPLVQLTGQQVHAWKKKYAAFAERMAEAEAIGTEMMLDELIEDAWENARCRDSASAVKEKRSATEAYLAARFPERFRTSLLKPSIGGDGSALLGVVLVPMKVTHPQEDERPVIEGHAVRVPMKSDGS